MFPSLKTSAMRTEFELQDAPTTPLHNRLPQQRMRRDSQYRAVAHAMNKTVAGRFIRTRSAWFLLTLAIYTAVYVGVTVQDLRRNLYLADSPLAKLNFFVVTFMVFTLPLMCRYFLTTLAGALAGLLLGERGYSVPSACLLLAANLGSRLDMQQYSMLVRGAEKGIRSVLLIRLLGDYVVHLSVPSVSLAFLVRLANGKCWMGYDWSWLLFALVWPSIWSLAVLVYMIAYWNSQQCIRAGATLQVSLTLQAALDLALVLKDADGDANRLSGMWRYGHKIMRGEGYVGVDQSFLGLVREEECISLTDMLLAIEREDGTYGGKFVQGI